MLELTRSTRSLGLGAPAVSDARGLDALWDNPAGMGVSARPFEAAASQGLLPEGVAFRTAATAARLRAGWTLAAAVATLDQPALEALDAEGRPAGDFAPSERLVQAALSAPLSARLSAGVGVKHWESRIGEYSARTAAFDAGLQARWFSGLSLGIAARGLGARARYRSQFEPMPGTLGLGAAWQLAGLPALRVEISRALEPGAAARATAGLEMPMSAGPARLALRAGAWPLSGGFGLDFPRWGLDYAFTALGAIGPRQQLGLKARWGGGR